MSCEFSTLVCENSKNKDKYYGTDRNAMNYLLFTVRIFHVCAKNQSAVKPRDAIGGKEKPALILVSCRSTQRSLSLPYRLPYPHNIFSYFELMSVYFCLIPFLKIKFNVFFS